MCLRVRFVCAQVDTTVEFGTVRIELKLSSNVPEIAQAKETGVGRGAPETTRRKFNIDICKLNVKRYPGLKPVLQGEQWMLSAHVLKEKDEKRKNGKG